MYQKSLEALKALAVKQGDLKMTKAALAEIDRFQKAKSLPATPDDKEIEEIKAFLSAYVKRYSELETEMTAKLGTLTTKYEQALDRLQKELVKAEKLDAVSFMGRLRARTGQAFDLPTEAQWEYACRAGTVTALNSGKNLTSAEGDPNMAEVGRYKSNAGGGPQGGGGDTHTGTAQVGSYLPNAWGLYDLHGNVWEWCLDWCGNYSGSESDPKGAPSGSGRARRGETVCSTAFRRQRSQSGFRATTHAGVKP